VGGFVRGRVRVIGLNETQVDESRHSGASASAKGVQESLEGKRMDEIEKQIAATCCENVKR
jgi:hypothetical protein